MRRIDGYALLSLIHLDPDNQSLSIGFLTVRLLGFVILSETKNEKRHCIGKLCHMKK